MPPREPNGRKATVIRRPPFPLYLGLFGQFQRVIDLYSEISNGAFKFGVAKQELHRPKVFGPPVHQ
jgi:hypothetical protein